MLFGFCVGDGFVCVCNCFRSVYLESNVVHYGLFCLVLCGFWKGLSVDACVVAVVLVSQRVVGDLWAGEFGVEASDKVCLGVLESYGLCHVLGGSMGLFWILALLPICSGTAILRLLGDE